jgi:hypothetical protein
MTDETLRAAREEIISQNIDARRHSVMIYDINITNYEMAIARIDLMEDADEDMVEYRGHLNELLTSERRERKKEVLILSVLEAQLP